MYTVLSETQQAAVLELGEKKSIKDHLTAQQRPDYQTQTSTEASSFPSACQLSSCQRYPAVQSYLYGRLAPNAAQITHDCSYRPSVVHY